jgi:hypothetical protein
MSNLYPLTTSDPKVFQQYNGNIKNIFSSLGHFLAHSVRKHQSLSGAVSLLMFL